MITTTPVALPPMLARPDMPPRPTCTYGGDGFCVAQATVEVTILWSQHFGMLKLCADSIAEGKIGDRLELMCDKHRDAYHDIYALGTEEKIWLEHRLKVER